MPLTIQSNVSGKVAALQLKGSIAGILDATDLRDQIGSASSAGVLWVVLDCTDLTYVNSLGLGMIIASLTALRNRGGDVCLSCVSSDIIESLTKTLLTRVIQIFDTTEQAVAAFGGKDSK